MDAAAADKWSNVQSRYFKQCRECAGDLGLTISSRCKLVLPPKEDEGEDEFTAFLNRRKAAGSE
jgi:P27 family predicted phage terminase small subunit